MSYLTLCDSMWKDHCEQLNTIRNVFIKLDRQDSCIAYAYIAFIHIFPALKELLFAARIRIGACGLHRASAACVGHGPPPAQRGHGAAQRGTVPRY